MGSAILVREEILFPPPLSKSVNFILCKNSFVGYKLIALQLQVKFKNVSEIFFSPNAPRVGGPKWDGICY